MSEPEQPAETYGWAFRHGVERETGKMHFFVKGRRASLCSRVPSSQIAGVVQLTASPSFTKCKTCDRTLREGSRYGDARRDLGIT